MIFLFCFLPLQDFFFLSAKCLSHTQTYRSLRSLTRAVEATSNSPQHTLATLLAFFFLRASNLSPVDWTKFAHFCGHLGLTFYS